MARVAPLPTLLFVCGLAACAPDSGLPDPGEEVERGQRPFASAEATLVTFELDGELIAPWQANAKKLVKQQLFYTVGQLNAHHSVSRLDKVVITDVVKSASEVSGWMKVRYHASLPVGWGSKTEIPETFALTFPRRIGPKSLAAFTESYAGTCVEGGDHAVTSGNFWYHFRPAAPGCTFDPARVSLTNATVTVSPANTVDRYPEYDRVWADGTLRVVAVFGKYTDYATAANDAGIAAYSAFVDALRTGLASGLATTPAVVPPAPGVAAPDVTFEGQVDGHAVSITALLIDSPKVATAAFDTRFATLTKNADVISYNGHAGLGANVQALAKKGKIAKGQYRIFFMNGCDTFAYLDDTLANRVAAANPDDPAGTKYLDVVVNLMPAYFSSMPTASMALVEALANPGEARTYEQIFTGIDSEQVVAVTGEEDNTYLPVPQPFDGMSVTDWVATGDAESYATPLLPAGTYVVRLDEAKPKAAGDADLYVGVGYVPSLEVYDARPYLDGSNEQATLTLAHPAVLHMVVRGYDKSPVPANHFVLSVEP